jgi:hypothetical protein
VVKERKRVKGEKGERKEKNIQLACVPQTRTKEGSHALFFSLFVPLNALFLVFFFLLCGSLLLCMYFLIHPSPIYINTPILPNSRICMHKYPHHHTYNILCKQAQNMHVSTLTMQKHKKHSTQGIHASTCNIFAPACKALPHSSLLGN